MSAIFWFAADRQNPEGCKAEDLAEGINIES